MGNYGLLHFVCEQWRNVAPVLTTDLSGKTIVVVGANIGIGFEASKHFASMKPSRLIMACRNEQKGMEAVAKIRDATGFQAEMWPLDLAKFSSVINFADKFEKEKSHLDILIMNAGIYTSTYVATPDGWESTLQVNHLSTALLSLLLLPSMARVKGESSTTRAPRLVIVSSDLYALANVDKDAAMTPSLLKTLGSKEYCTPKNMRTRYNLSKLFNVFFARAFDAHLSSPVVTINSLHPGFCYSELAREIRAHSRAFRAFQAAFALTSEQGSRVVVRAAIWDKKEEELRGAFLSGEIVKEANDYVTSKIGRAAQERVWLETISILSEVDPRVKTIVNEYMKKDD